METKATNINYITPKGTKVAIRIERKYGYYIQPAWTEKVWLDQPLEITHEEEQKFEDSAVILVNLAGKSVRATRVHKGEAPLGTKFGEGLYAELAGGKKAFIQLSDEVAETIDELCVEILNDDEPQEVVKKVKVNSDYFNTLCDNDKEPNLIKAIIDENIKAVDGSRVRLRLLDDIEINDIVVHKGSYLYATMSGFSSQRATGKIESVLVNDELIKISLSIYDLDGIEGLYIPESQFRETAKDVVGSATEQSMQFNNTGTGSMAQWVAQATQNAYQKTSQAIGKAIKKKSVRLKYGTHVYLINGKPKSKKEK